ncbi:hypothetical protein BLA24_14295 [Streptomyces cinnamoneus]|uniref:HTH cro/C1-type domain-containing protein n=1 Tax=Streptomyces cinnamoneus TaxID=53446 RepID=A0A2G1XIF5_STRCJ|nr:hypothetical protein [Streptomyces cinnamoneus]PHQ50961.1 hypothetical protein BLA24_14295 [Streptomyces cinnamoneus]PPT13817.1 hypothetical protein CYQ11_13780 [Streptomyces cinnamoneus]
MGELLPFGDGLSPETRALAQALRELFAGLGISERRYAARRSYDSSTVSRYLSGQRMPSWEFVLNLLHDVAEERGTVPTAETTEMLRARHTAALKAGKSPTHKVQLLEQQLAVADQQARKVAARERWLEDTLRDREHRIRDLQMQLQAGPGPLGPEAGALGDDHVELRAEIEQLKQELARARALHRQAEERCEELERQLAEADRGEGEGAKPVGVVPEGDSVAGWTGTVIHGDVHVTTAGGWNVDEELVASATVSILTQGVLSNGLLVDRTTVVTSWASLSSVVMPAEAEVLDRWHGTRVPARVVERLPPEMGPVADSSRPYPGLAVLRLSRPWTAPTPALRLGRQPLPGSQLLVNASGGRDAETAGPYSCLLEVKGRTGSWLRVEGELVRGLWGAPAFNVATGELVGMVSSLNMTTQKGLLAPAEALLDLTTLNFTTP